LATAKAKAHKEAKAAKTHKVAKQAKPAHDKVYRCHSGGISGSVSYSHTPCDAQASAMRLEDTRTDAQIRHSRDMAERDQALADRMKREREHDARMAAQHGAASLSGSAGQARQSRREARVDRAGKGASSWAEKPRRQKDFRAVVSKQAQAN
jgi:hypothetical protein